MATFNFPFHKCRIKFPDDQARMRFGRNFVYASDPVIPLQRTFYLKLSGIQWTTDGTGAAIVGPVVTRDALTLYNFYLTHRLGVTFDYPVPGFTTVKARFSTPLELPEAEVGGTGVLPEFEIELIEVPA
jgi:hypothetical protein